MTHGSDGDGWDAFDWNAWGAGDEPGTDASDGSLTNGHAPAEPSEERDEALSTEGHWVRSGGTLQWEEPDEGGGERVSLRSEAHSHWADDNVDLPLGAPSRLRVRAMRAWLARQRELEQEAQGMVLLERRRQRDEDGDEEPAPGDERDPFTLALAERQAAAAEYERLLEVLAELESHSGLDRVLIEFYLWLGERIATLALAPEAPADFRAAALVAEPETSQRQPAPTPLSLAEWQGRAEAVLATRRHAERVSAPEEGE